MIVKELYEKNEKITLESYLNKCGVKDIDEFLNPTNKYIDNCNLYYNMHEAVQEFKYHLLQNDGAYILCDSGDTDGITSTVMMYQYMKYLNNDWDIEILLHSGKQRGLQDEELFEKVMNNQKGLLIIPDSGTNDVSQVNEIYKKFDNTSVIVLDHHNLDTPIEKGILVNNQDEKNNVSRCGSGALVTHKFLEALDIEFGLKLAYWFIDLVALSLVSDSMNMSDAQNRLYYHYGLETIDCINNKFLKEMFINFIGEKDYTQRDISFKVIPKINSVCRSKDQELKQRIILSFLENDNIDEVLKLCSEFHKNQINTVSDLIDANTDKIKELSSNNLIIFECDDMPRSYSGLVAGKIMNICDGKPTIVGKNIDGEFIGSLRSPIPLQEQLSNNELVTWARGHSDSCGICMPTENISKLMEYYNNLDISYEQSISVLKEFTISSLPNKLFTLFEPYGNLWGKGIEQPKFAISLEYNPKDIKIIGNSKTTLKLNSNGIDIMFFFMNKTAKVNLGLGYIENDTFVIEPLNKKMALRVIGTLGVNVWKNNKTNQIIVSDFEVSEAKKRTINNFI